MRVGATVRYVWDHYVAVALLLGSALAPVVYYFSQGWRP